MLLVAACLFATCSLFAQNSAAEINAEVYTTEIEKFINNCSYQKTEILDDFKTKSCVIHVIRVTNLKNGEKLCGIQFFVRDLGAAILSWGLDDGASLSLGFLDVSEIDDVITVLRDVINEAKAKSNYPYYINYVSNSHLEIQYSSENNRLDIGRSYEAVNDFGVSSEVFYATNDMTINEVGRLLKKMEKAKKAVISSSK